jgi:hypothetical protein
VQVQDDGEVEFKRDPYGRDGLILDILDRPLVPDAGRLEQAVKRG